MTDHLSWDTLNALADGEAQAPDREKAEVHLPSCAECAGTLHMLRTTVASAAALPRAVVPPAELWSQVRATIDARKVTALGVDVVPGAGGAIDAVNVLGVPDVAGIPAASLAQRARSADARRGWFVSPPLAVAAAVVLMALSSLTTLSLMWSPNEVTSNAPAGLVAASWQTAERGYLVSVEQLHRQLDGQRSRLAPATIAAVEASLATIDAAIAEARAALLTEPANATLPELLASNYRQKVELLRRATQLDAS